MKPKSEFPILIHFFGSQRAGWHFLKAKGVSEELWSAARSSKRISGLPRKVLMLEIMNRLINDESIWQSRDLRDE